MIIEGSHRPRMAPEARPVHNGAGPPVKHGSLRTVGSRWEQKPLGGVLSVAQRSSFVVVANRLPVDEVTAPDGEKQWRPSPGGLVTALHPVLTEHRGTWIGWAGGDGPAPE